MKVCLKIDCIGSCNIRRIERIETTVETSSERPTDIGAEMESAAKFIAEVKKLCER